MNIHNDFINWIVKEGYKICIEVVGRISWFIERWTKYITTKNILKKEKFWETNK